MICVFGVFLFMIWCFFFLFLFQHLRLSFAVFTNKEISSSSPCSERYEIQTDKRFVPMAHPGLRHHVYQLKQGLQVVKKLCLCRVAKIHCNEGDTRMTPVEEIWAPTPLNNGCLGPTSPRLTPNVILIGSSVSAQHTLTSRQTYHATAVTTGRISCWPT